MPIICLVVSYSKRLSTAPQKTSAFNHFKDNQIVTLLGWWLVVISALDLVNVVNQHWSSYCLPG